MKFNKNLLKNIGIAVVLLGGAGLIFIKPNTSGWYASTATAIVGFIFYSLGGGFGGKNDSQS